LKSDTPQGSAAHYEYNFGKTSIENTLSSSVNNVFMNAQVQSGNSELMGMSGATIMDKTTGKKKVIVKNQNQYDT
jgi:hypothetical protein